MPMMGEVTDGGISQKQRLYPFMCSADGQLSFSAPPWPGISQEAKDCVSRLLEPNVARRATVAEMLRDPWLVRHGVAVMAPLEHVILQRMRQAGFLLPCLVVCRASCVQFGSRPAKDLATVMVTVVRWNESMLCGITPYI